MDTPRYLTDGDGRRLGVVLDVDHYRQLLDALEEVEALRAYDEAKASGDEAVPFEDVVREIEAGRGA